MRVHESEAATAVPLADGGAAERPRSGPARDVFDALADGYRRDILYKLREGDRSVNELAAGLPISRPAVSRHLKLLLDAGLVAERHSGTKHIFWLRPEGARAVQDYLERVWGSGGERPSSPAQDPHIDSAEPPA